MICKVYQSCKRFSAVSPVFVNCQAGKQFSTVSSVICKVCQICKQFFAVTQVFINCVRQESSFLHSFWLFVEFVRQISSFLQLFRLFV